MTKKLQEIPLTQIIESPLNPRKHFDPKKLADMVASMKAHGQLTPVLVRPAGKKFELAAGHRRFRAAARAELATLDCVVRPLSDIEFIEILTIENDEREDLHPLEQAAGYKLLMTDAGYDVAKIAARLQRSHDFVYDRLRLLELLPALKEHFLEGRFGLSQALVLARLTHSEQTKVSRKPENEYSRSSGLWRQTGPTLDDDVFPLVAKTAPEIEAWIATHLRFDEKEVLLGEEFEGTAVALEAAAETGVRVVGITHDAHLPAAIERDPNNKIFTSPFWKRADGLEGSKACDCVVVGIIRVGEGRGESMGVCTSRDSCKVHWAARVREVEARKKAKGKSGASPKNKAKADAAAKRAEAARKAADTREREALARAKSAVGPIKAELAKQVKSGSKAILAHARQLLRGGPTWKAYTAEQFIIALAIDQQVRVSEWSITNDWQRKELVKGLRGFGIDLNKYLEAKQKESGETKLAEAAAGAHHVLDQEIDPDDG